MLIVQIGQAVFVYLGYTKVSLIRYENLANMFMGIGLFLFIMIQQNQGQFHRKGNSFIKPMQLRSVLLTHDSCKRAVLSQSRIQHALSCDVYAGSIFKLAFALCFKQDSLC